VDIKTTILCALFFAGAVTPTVSHAESAIRTVTSADGVPIQYEVSGSGEPTLLLVHGWTNNRTFWEPHTSALARSNRVVAVDLPGFGDSGMDRESWTMEAYGQDVAAVVRSLPNTKVVVVGFSMGGAAALEAARLVPDRMTGVILVDTLKNPDAKYSERSIRSILDQERSSWHDPSALRADFSPDAPDSLIRRYLDATPTSPPDHWWPILSDFFRWSSTRFPEMRHELRVPVVAINAEKPATDIDAWQRISPGFKLATVKGVGHLGVIWEKTGEFDAQLLEFIEGFAH
jgi:pimeloyl-ACP methyl ester carboxylesterase